MVFGVSQDGAYHGVQTAEDLAVPQGNESVHMSHFSKDDEGPTTGLSKNKLRKLKRQQAVEARKQERRARERAARQAAREERRQANADRMSAMTEEELEVWREEKARKVEERRHQKQEKKKKLSDAMRNGQRIVVDADFGELMTEKECRSLTQQLSYSYSANGRAEVPSHLIVTGIKGTMAQTLDKQIPGWKNWAATIVSDSYLDYFKGEEGHLVYLTADSPNELQELDPRKIYIVGGLVDRNRHKGLCLEKAERQGIATARLPIGHFMQLQSSQVMCTNHVVEMLIRWLEFKNWESAFRAVIPIRKRKAADEENVGERDTAEGQEETKNSIL